MLRRAQGVFMIPQLIKWFNLNKIELHFTAVNAFLTLINEYV